MISYAQNFEDVILKRALSDVEEGRYLDIGANDPDKDSVSKAFYVDGWRGVHIEPIASYAQALRAARPDETVIEAAVTTAPGSIKIFDVADTGLSTGIVEYAAKHRSAGFTVDPVEVASVTLASVFAEMGDDPIHWLKIDVEGMEKDVLASWGDAPQRPWIVLVEATEPNSPLETHGEWESALTHRGYSLQYFDGLNRFYLHKDQSARARFFGPGPNPFDDFMLSSTSPYVGVVKEEAQALGLQLKRDLETLQQTATQREGDLKAQIAQAQAELVAVGHDLECMRQQSTQRERDLQSELSQARAYLAAAHRDVARLSQVISGQSVWPLINPLRCLVLPDGTPRSFVRWGLFRANGQPRPLTSALVIRRNGRPRSLFRRWMDSPSFIRMCQAHDFDRGLSVAGTMPDLPWRSASDKDELSEEDLTALMNHIRAELKTDAT